MKTAKRAENWLPKISRRRFFQSTGAAAAVMTAGFKGVAVADELPRIDENDPIAQSLNYVHDAKTVDAAKRASNQYCNNCALFAGKAEDEWAGCGIFPGKTVAGQGWCSVWAKK